SFFCVNTSPTFTSSQLGGTFLLGLGVWVIVDPTGFREIIAANPLMFMGAYLVLAMGAMLFLLGFLGCCGAIRENKCLLLFLTRDFFTKELKKHYQGNNSTDIFTSTWNSVMVTFECCGVNGPEDFGETLHFRAHSYNAVPEACCRRNVLRREAEILSKAECMSSIDLNRQGCYSTILSTLEPYLTLLCVPIHSSSP
ncbi:hypothetical protein AB205_0142560, partial [Aquarana catesbeiana]